MWQSVDLKETTTTKRGRNCYLSTICFFLCVCIEQHINVAYNNAPYYTNSYQQCFTKLIYYNLIGKFASTKLLSLAEYMLCC